MEIPTVIQVIILFPGGSLRESETCLLTADSIPVLEHETLSRHSGIFVCKIQWGKKLFSLEHVSLSYSQSTSIVKAIKIPGAIFHSLHCRKEHYFYTDSEVAQRNGPFEQCKSLNKNCTSHDERILMKQELNLDLLIYFSR